MLRRGCLGQHCLLHPKVGANIDTGGAEHPGRAGENEQKASGA